MRWRRMGWLAALALLIAWSARGVGVDPALLFGADGRGHVGDFIAGLFPPELSVSYLLGLGKPALETLQMSLVGVVGGVLIASPLAVLAARPVSGFDAGRVVDHRWRRVVYAIARGVLNLMRTVPDLVWALMFIAAVGLGPFAGVLALTVHSAGLLGKLYAETLESVDAVPVDTMRVTGASRLATLLWAVLPQSAGPLVSVTLYQWECNIRSAMVLGFVGAGGLGQEIDLAMRLFRYNELLTLLFVLLLLVTAVDRLSAFLRGRIVTSGI